MHSSIAGIATSFSRRKVLLGFTTGVWAASTSAVRSSVASRHRKGGLWTGGPALPTGNR